MTALRHPIHPYSACTATRYKKSKLHFSAPETAWASRFPKLSTQRIRHAQRKSSSTHAHTFIHISVTTPDVEDAVGRLGEKGGGLIGKTVEPEEDLHGEVRKATYVDDHWSTVVEMLSCASDALMVNRQWTWSQIDL
jgi:hypothetical protein